MKTAHFALIGAGLLLMGFCFQGQAEEKKEGAKAGGDLTYEGTFIRGKKKNKTYPLKAVFTPDGDKKWKVVWTFQWQKKPKTFKGTVEGDLLNGNLTGKSSTQNGKRNWTFEGTAKDGVLTCKHNEIKGKEKPGTFSITKK